MPLPALPVILGPRSALRRFTQPLQQLPALACQAIVFGLWCFIFWVDVWLTRPTVQLTGYYLLPILVAAWLCGWRVTAVVTALSIAANVYVVHQALPHDASPWDAGVAYALECVVLAGFATLSVALRSVVLRLEHERNTDALTGLRNRRGFLEIAEHELKDASQSGSGVSLVTIDLDNFKSINDTLGHAAGDQLLVEVATCMRQTFRSTDCLGRLGGDEFAVLLPNVSEPDAAVLLERIRNHLLPVFERFGGTAGMSVGLVSTTDGGGQKIAELLARSDKLMYSTKQKRKAIEGCTEAGSRHDAREALKAVQADGGGTRAANRSLSAPNASDRLPYGPSTGPPDGPISAQR